MDRHEYRPEYSQEEREAVAALEKDGYSPVVIDHWLHPRNFGPMANHDGYSGRVISSCGDSMSFWLKVKDGVIQQAAYISDICIGAVSTGSMLSGMITGKSIRAALWISPDNVIGELQGLPEQYIHCASLAVSALQSAIQDYNEYKTDPWKRLYLPK